MDAAGMPQKKLALQHIMILVLSLSQLSLACAATSLPGMFRGAWGQSQGGGVLGAGGVLRGSSHRFIAGPFCLSLGLITPATTSQSPSSTMLLTLEVQPGRGLAYFSLGTASRTAADSHSP